MTVKINDSFGESKVVESQLFGKYSLLREKKRIDLLSAVPLSGPMSIYIETTNICNFKCKFCPESFENYKEKSGGLFKMDAASFIRIADQIKEIGTVKTLNFYMMGEPFANKNLISYVNYAKNNNVASRVIVTSNGTLLNEDKYKDLCETNLDFLRISIYGANDDTHKQITQSPVKLSRIIDNVSGLKNFRNANGFSRPYIYIKMIESTSSYENEEFLRVFKDVGDEVTLEPVMNWNDPTEGILANINHEELLKKDYFKIKKKVCPFPFYTLIIHSDLQVSVCCVDWDKKTVIGNLKNNSLREIWNGEKLKNFQILHLSGRRKELEGCKNCTYLHTAPDNLDKLTAIEYLSRF